MESKIEHGEKETGMNFGKVEKKNYQYLIPPT